MRLIQQIKATQATLGMTDDAHRKNVLEVSKYRVSTCTKLTIEEQKTLLTRYRSFLNKPKKAKPLPEALRHIYRLWGRLASAGLVNEDSLKACHAFCERHTQGVALRKAADSWQHIIEILKGWLARGKRHDTTQPAV
jgi:hypothetical protein